MKNLANKGARPENKVGVGVRGHVNPWFDEGGFGQEGLKRCRCRKASVRKDGVGVIVGRRKMEPMGIRWQRTSAKMM